MLKYRLHLAEGLQGFYWDVLDEGLAAAITNVVSTNWEFGREMDSLAKRISSALWIQMGLIWENGRPIELDFGNRVSADATPKIQPTRLDFRCIGLIKCPYDFNLLSLDK